MRTTNPEKRERTKRVLTGILLGTAIAAASSAPLVILHLTRGQ